MTKVIHLQKNWNNVWCGALHRERLPWGNGDIWSMPKRRSLDPSEATCERCLKKYLRYLALDAERRLNGGNF